MVETMAQVGFQQAGKKYLIEGEAGGRVGREEQVGEGVTLASRSFMYMHVCSLWTDIGSNQWMHGTIDKIEI